MKPYFAKFIPQPGRVETGDHYLFEGKVYFCKGSIMKELEELYDRPIIEYQKIKLCLCSRDIKIGDEVTHTRYGKMIVKNFNGSWLSVEPKESQYTDVQRKDVFKVIGEISPDAWNYVKEGDEFDEHEINRQWYDDSGSSDNSWMDFVVGKYVTIEDWDDTLERFKRIQIKDQYGHFH